MAAEEHAAAADDAAKISSGVKRSSSNCCPVKKRTIAIALFGVGVVAAVIIWGIVRNMNSSSSPANRTISVTVELHPSSILHIWLKTRQEEQRQPAQIHLRNAQGGDFLLAQAQQHKEFDFHETAPGMDGQFTLDWTTGDTWVSYIYVYEPESVLELGIRPAFIASAARLPEMPESYHFRAPLGWINDPNGFSKLGPYYHLFYQHYPHALRWNAMHWGHAVSRDLVNWVHLPIFLLPDPSVGLHNEGKGGIFSGSAVPMPWGLRIFYTDNYFGRKPMELQRMVDTRDGIHPFGRAQTIIPEGPIEYNLTQDFRDPNVILGPDGKWKMVLGSRDDQGGVMLLYGTDDPEAAGGWHFLNILFRDDRMGMTVAECSGLLPIGDPRDPNTLWALIYAQLDSTDPRTGRRDITPAIVGTFDGFRFRPLFEQEMDFGTHAYAFQGFHSQEEGTLVIAWLASWKDWSWDTKPDFPSSMTMPRRLILGRDRRSLLTPPLESVVAKLRDHRLDDGRLLQGGQSVELPNGTAEVQLQIGGEAQQPGTILRLEIGHPKLSQVGVELSPEGLEILPGQVMDPARRLIALEARPQEVRVFLDTASIEVFADGGRWAGTVRLPGADKFTSIRLIGNTEVLSRSEVWALRPAQYRGRLQPAEWKKP